MAVKELTDASEDIHRFGIVRMAEDGRITNFEDILENGVIVSCFFLSFLFLTIKVGEPFSSAAGTISQV